MSTTRTTLVKCRRCQHVGEPLKAVNCIQTALRERFCEECYSWDVEPYHACTRCGQQEALPTDDWCETCVSRFGDESMLLRVSA